MLLEIYMIAITLIVYLYAIRNLYDSYDNEVKYIYKALCIGNSAYACRFMIIGSDIYFCLVYMARQLFCS